MHQAPTYGLAPSQLPRKKQDDARLGWLPIVHVPRYVVAGTFILPFIIFMVIVNLLISKLHHIAPKLVWVMLYAFCVMFAIYILGALYWLRINRLTGRKWHFIYSLLVLVSLFSGIWTGDKIFYSYAYAWYTMNDLASYIMIDPANAKGQSYMDVGRATFKEGTRVDTAYARAFVDRHTYCVAPIVGQPMTSMGTATSGSAFQLPPSGTVDFWAIGIDCCLPSGEQFECAQVTNTLARSGMRLLRDDQRLFYKLAVQEWSTEFKLPVEHPLFFYWVQDPVEEVEAYDDNTTKTTWLYAGMYTIANSVFAFLLYFFLPEAESERPVDWEAVSIRNQRKMFLTTSGAGNAAAV